VATGSATTTSVTLGGLNCGTNHTFAIAASDAVGNVSTGSSVSFATSPCSGNPPPPSGNVITAAGDIAASGGGQAGTAALVNQINPALALTLGDNAYENGSVNDYNSFYQPSWGSFLAKTNPAPGNHDYQTSGAAGYFTYYGARAPAPYYSFDLAGWHLIALNSEISHSAGSAQDLWLINDLATHQAPCVLAYWHKPRFSSGSTHGSDSSFTRFWTDLVNAHADIVLNGHEHNYERFAQQNASGVASSTGLRAFVVGTGGRSHYSFGTAIANSQFRNNAVYGVLKLTLNASSYDFQFISSAGQVLDSGSGSCVP
jgi:hypothetical protein